jgi:DNA repair photolyase
MADAVTSTGRGAGFNPANRFEALSVEPDVDWDPSEERPLRTQFLRDLSQTIISYNESPDIPFRASLNPYRGCEHGCAYCYARPTHEYLGFSAGLDFESRIMVKENAPELLRAELGSRKWEPQWIALSGVTDPYQPIEKKLQITRRCLEVLAEFRNPVVIVTKNRLVTRDLDVLAELGQHNAVCVYLSLTTLRPELRRSMEPRTATPAARLETIRALAAAGIPVGVLTAPIIPGLNDEEIPALLTAAAAAGAKFAGYVMLRLPLAVRPLFEDWLERCVPERKDKVLNQLRSMRDGKLNSAEFGDRMRGHGLFAEQIRQLFQVSARKAGLHARGPELSTASFRRPGGRQLELLPANPGKPATEGIILPPIGF